MSYIIVKYDNEYGRWILHESENTFTGEPKVILYKTEDEATEVAENLELEYEIYKFIKDSFQKSI